MSRVEKALQKQREKQIIADEESIKIPDKALLLEMAREDYASIFRERADFPILIRHLNEIGLPHLPSKSNTIAELEECIDLINNIDNIVISYINKSLDDENELINKIKEYCKTEENEYLYIKLREFAKKNIKNFYKVFHALDAMNDNMPRYWREEQELISDRLDIEELVRNTMLDILINNKVDLNINSYNNSNLNFK